MPPNPYRGNKLQINDAPRPPKVGVNRHNLIVCKSKNSPLEGRGLSLFALVVNERKTKIY